MNQPTTCDDLRGAEKPWPSKGFGVLSLVSFWLVAFIATSAGSFWIDEFVTARYAAWPSFVEGWQHMVQVKTAEVQMPFYMVYVWLYEKVFGTGEWALRFSTAPWLVAGLTALMVSMRRSLGCGVLTVVVFALSPFIWYYQNEARLYAMQIGTTSLVAAALISLGREAGQSEGEEAFWVRSLVVGVILLSAISMLGMVWASSALLIAVVVFPVQRLKEWFVRYPVTILCFAVALMGLGLYYLWSVKAGARATAVATTTWQTVIFVIYEIAGFAGLGPGRAELREAGAASLKPFLPGLVLYAIALAIVLGAGLKGLFRAISGRKLALVAGCLAFPAAFLLSTGVLMQFRVLGRHFAPAVVILLILLAWGSECFWRRRGKWRCVVFGFTGILAVSCLSLRFAARHAKDDYRTAATIAKDKLGQGATIWWNAEEIGARFYGVTNGLSPDGINRLTFLTNPPSEFASGKEKPKFVITSKSDIYDANASVKLYLDQHGYRLWRVLPAFKIWSRGDEN